MDLEMKVQQLQADIELMKQVYFKGFSNALCSIRDNCDSYLDRHGEDTKRDILTTISLLEQHYTSIPFDRLDSNSKYAPVFVVKPLLEEYFAVVKGFLEHPSEGAIASIRELLKTIGGVGFIFEATFRSTIRELRGISGYEEFQVTITDYEGKTFQF